MTRHVHVEDAGAIRTITLARPEQKNALSRAMYQAMADALASAETDPGIRVVVVRGEGGVFTAGNDLAEFAAQPVLDDAAPAVAFLRHLAALTKPLVACVDGQAIGIGTTMLLHCDVVVCSTRSRFHLPFVELALVPEAAATLLLPLDIGRRLAAELLLLAEPFDATRARELGIVNRVVSEAALADEVGAIAHRLADLPAQAVRETKRLLRRPITESVAERMAIELAAFRERLASDELKAAIGAFFAKRKR